MAEVAKRAETDEHQPREGVGLVRLTFREALRVPALDALTYQAWSRLVACPQCGASVGISLEARHRTTVAICPREECGRAWPANDVFTASQIRQMNHLRMHGQEVTLPHPHQLTVNLVPELDGDDLALADDPLADHDGRSLDPATRWSIGTTAIAGQDAPPLVVSLGWARGLLSWSLPADGDLCEYLYPPVGGSALDAHMVQVVLGLVIHQAAFTRELYEIGHVELEALAAELDDDRLEQLRGVRPTGMGAGGGRLRRSDVHRLENATDEQWRLWCHLAGEVIADHCRASHSLHADTKGSTLPLTERIRPWAGRLGSCRGRFQSPGLDLTWYQGSRG